jgi:hypothetical protein
MVVPAQTGKMDTMLFCNEVGITKDIFIERLKAAVTYSRRAPSVFLIILVECFSGEWKSYPACDEVPNGKNILAFSLLSFISLELTLAEIISISGWHTVSTFTGYPSILKLLSIGWHWPV